jgi:hypothetical protein
MTCHDARESLSAYLDEALSADERRLVEAHLAGCPECARELERLRGTVALLHRVEPAHAPAGFVDRVVEAARPRPWYRRLLALAFLPLSAKLPVEATALVMVALLAVYLVERTPTLKEAAREPAPRQESGGRLVERAERLEPAGRPALGERRAERDREEARAPRDASPPLAAAPPAAPAPTAAPAAPAPAPPPAVPGPPAAPSAAGPAPSPPAAAKAESPAEGTSANLARPDAESRQQALERAAGSARPVPSAPRLAAKRAQPPADVVARVSVKDREAAERELAQLIARVGGRETERRREDEATVVEALVPQSRYAEFSQGLGGIGAWQVETERPDLPAQVRIILRLSE